MPDEREIAAALRAHGETLPDPPWPLLGRGVWGAVHDLGDGTVLKLVKHKGGIGSGAAIFQGERDALARLGGLEGPVRTARLVASGELEGALCGWLQMTRLAGTTAQALLTQAPDEARKAAIMFRIGEAAAQFHAAAAPLAPPGGMPAIWRRRLAEIEDIVPAMGAACGEVADALGKAPALAFLHGDINPPNVLLDGDAAGLVDLGEAQSGPAALDLRHAFDFAGPANAMFEGYATVGGEMPGDDTIAASVALNALGTLAIAKLGTVAGLDPDKALINARARLGELGKTRATDRDAGP